MDIKMERNPLFLFISIPAAFFIIFVRYLAEDRIFIPLGKSFGLKPQPNTKHATTKISYEKLKRSTLFCKTVVKPSKLAKFSESCWRLGYYTFIWCYGLIMLLNKPWFWNINECWTDFDDQKISWDMFFYGGFQISFYLSLSISQFFDVKRKDFWEMFIHHVVCVLIVCMAWVLNFARIGTLVVIVHDVSDIFLEAAKITKYVRLNLLSNIFIALFTLVWIITRLVIYTVWILRHSLLDPSGVLRKNNAYFAFNGLLLMLYVLNCLWTYLIFKFIFKGVRGGQFKKDIRSDSESDSDD